jgi:hypothetical protein
MATNATPSYHIRTNFDRGELTVFSFGTGNWRKLFPKCSRRVDGKAAQALKNLGQRRVLILFRFG